MFSRHEKGQLYLRDVSFGSLWQIVTIVSTGAYSKGVNGVTSSTTAQMFPYFVCSAYMIITPVILISYVLGHRMPEILVSIYHVDNKLLSKTGFLEQFLFYLLESARTSVPVA